MSNNSNTPPLNLQPPPETRTLRKRIGKWLGNKFTKKTGKPKQKTSGERLVPARPIHKRVWSGIRGLAGKTKKQINAQLHDPLVVKYKHRTPSGKLIAKPRSNILGNSESNSTKARAHLQYAKPTIRDHPKKLRLLPPAYRASEHKPAKNNNKINYSPDLPAPKTPLDMPAPRFGFKDIFTDTKHDILGDENKYIEKLHRFHVAEYDIIYNPNARHMVLVIGKNNFYRFRDIYDEKIKAQLNDIHKNAIENAITLLKSKHIRYDMQGKYYYFLQGERKYTNKNPTQALKKTEFGTPNIEANVHALEKFVNAIKNAFASIKTLSEPDA